MVFVRLVENRTQTIRRTLNLFPKTSKANKQSKNSIFILNRICLLRIIRIKKERRQKEVQKKQKLSENRRHLSDVRVVQKNLVFVVGLSQRLADIEVLKKIEYFGRFGKILKVVVNSSPSYAGTQVSSLSFTCPTSGCVN